MSRWLPVVLALGCDGLAGVTAALFSEPWLARRGPALVSFAAGALIAAALLDVLPEAISELGPVAPAWAFGGFVGALTLEWLLGGHHHDGREPRATLPLVLLASDAVHNVGDGAAIAAAFLHSERAGIVMAIAVIAHEVPEEVGDYAILRRAGYGRRRALLSLGVVQLTAVIGAIAVAIASAQAHRLAAYILAIASGSFLYIGATDLLPELRRSATGSARAAAFALGVGAIVLAGVLGK